MTGGKSNLSQSVHQHLLGLGRGAGGPGAGGVAVGVKVDERPADVYSTDIHNEAVMDRTQAIAALQQTGNLLAQAAPSGRVTLILGGAVAAMVVADLPATRVTHDCDVVESEPESGWETVHQAARQVAQKRGLPVAWLNRDSRMYAHLLPIGWRKRCETVGRFGPLDVLAIGRRDLMAMKLMGAPVRPQDLEDIIAMRPTAEDIAFLHKHLDRLDAESLIRETHDASRAILNDLEPCDGSR